VKLPLIVGVTFACGAAGLLAIQMSIGKAAAQPQAGGFDIMGPVRKQCQALPDSGICIVKFNDGTKCVTLIPEGGGGVGGALQCSL
jgi:hypothetical protein